MVSWSVRPGHAFHRASESQLSARQQPRIARSSSVRMRRSSATETPCHVADVVPRAALESAPRRRLHHSRSGRRGQIAASQLLITQDFTSRAAKKPSNPASRGSACGRWQGRVRRSPVGVISSLEPPTSPASTGARRRPGSLGEQIRDRLLAFFGLERTGAVNQRSAGLEQATAWRSRWRCSAASGGDVGFAASARRCRDGGGSCRSRCRARRPARVERAAVPFGGVGGDDLGV